MKKHLLTAICCFLAAASVFTFAACKRTDADKTDPLSTAAPTQNDQGSIATDTGKTTQNGSEPSAKQVKTDSEITAPPTAVSGLVYDGSPQVLITAGKATGGTMKYSLDKVSYSSDLPTGIEAGDYTIWYMVEGDDAHNDAAPASLSNSIVMPPTATAIVEARQAVVAENSQNYDFRLALSGKVTIGGVAVPEANANYEGKYRFDNDDTKFFRETSGSLLYVSREYIYMKNGVKYKLKTDKNDVAEKISAISEEEEELTMINLPFVSVVDNLEADNFKNIRKSENPNYAYQAKIMLASDNSRLQTVIGEIGKLGTNIEMKQISVPNIADGIDFYFDLKDGRLDAFSFGAKISVGESVTLDLNYEQNADNSEIVIPDTNGIFIENNQINAVLEKISDAVNAVKAKKTFR